MKWFFRLAGILIFLSPACDNLQKTESLSPLEKIRQQGVLIVLTHNTSTTYYEAQDGLAGFEYDLVTDFATHLGVKTRFEVLEGVSEILKAIKEGQGDIAAAGLIRTERREQEYLFGPDYYQVEQQVVCHRGSESPESISDLPKFQITIVKDGGHEERMHEIQHEVPEIQWTVVSDASIEMLLQKVSKKELECVVADSNIVSINLRYFPELEVAFSLTDVLPVAWIIRPGAEDLRDEILHWLEKYESDHKLTALKERYYSYLAIFDYVDIRTFHKRLSKRLPSLLPLFKKAAEKYNLSWTLLAAQAYQESHWDPRATSPTGVQGMMMLTMTTARQLGIKNRLDTEQSIMGGANYLAQLLDRVPQNVQGDDRLWFALAAYNVGMGHVHDARTLAKRFGKNPDKWHDLKTVLPLLSQREYYKTLKRGYARGSEPVRYVQRIREFHDILTATMDSGHYQL